MTEFLKMLHHADKGVTLAINSIHCPASDAAWLIFSDKEIWFILYAVVLFFLFRNLGWKKAVVATLAVVLTVVCCDQFANFTKNFFGRLRPCCDLEMTANGLRCLCRHRSIEYGFYSAHAANAMGFAVGTLLAFRLDKGRKYRIYGICVVLWAMLVGISRIFVGMHFAGDVITGLAAGALIAWAWMSAAAALIRWFTQERCDRLLTYHKYYKRFRRFPDLDNPVSFNEKLLWLKLHDHNPAYTRLVDKYEVKKYVDEVLGGGYTIPTLQVYDRFRDIPWDSLPEEFVLKTTHDSGGYAIKRAGKPFNRRKSKAKIHRHFLRNYYYRKQEWPYRNATRRIMLEPLVKDDSGALWDYKFYCFDSVPYCVMVCVDRDIHDTKFIFFDMDWKLLRINALGAAAPEGFTLPKPKCFDEMKDIAARLSKGLPFARIDLYNVQDRPLFGEITFYPSGGFDTDYTPEAMMQLGSMLRLPVDDRGRTLFVVNPISGSGGRERMVKAIRRHYRSAPYEIVTTERPGHAVELARDSDASMIVAVGGDGTVGEVARGIVESGDRTRTLGILPCGSGDGLALHLGFSRRPVRAVRSLDNPSTEEIDYATISDGGEAPRMFFSIAGAGFDADVAASFASSGHRGLWNYIACAIRLWRRFEPEEYEVIIDGRKVCGKACMVTVGNSSQWGNNARIAPLASVTDGLLDVSIARPFSTLRIPMLACRLMTGRLAGTRGLEIYKGREITIIRKTPGAVHIDGDPCTMGERIDIKVHPAAIKVAVPRG